MKLVLLLLGFVARLACAQERLDSPHDRELYALAQTNLKAFAEKVSNSADSELGKSQLVVQWLAEHFEWKATDYQKRTIQEIIYRRGGNCDELAMVAVAYFEELNIKMRRVREINVRKETVSRGETARRMVREKGKRMSVFGRHHNDHVWLELYDRRSSQWYPADPSIGVVGTEEWLSARAGFGKRYTLDPVSEDMIVPFAILASNDSGGFTVNRTQHYLVDGLNRLYLGKPGRFALWGEWVRILDSLDNKALGAFQGEVNLHEYEREIDTLAEVYEMLRK